MIGESLGLQIKLISLGFWVRKNLQIDISTVILYSLKGQNVEGDLDTHFHLSNGKNFRLAQHLVLCTVGESYYRIHYICKENLSATSSIWIAVISTCCSIPRLSLKPLRCHSSLTWTKKKLARIKITKTTERIFMKLQKSSLYVRLWHLPQLTRERNRGQKLVDILIGAL